MPDIVDHKETQNLRSFALCFKAFIAFQVIVIFGLVNPWSEIFSTISLILLAVDLIILLLWCVPVFFYNIFKKRRSVKEAFKVAIVSFFDIVSVVGL